MTQTSVAAPASARDAVAHEALTGLAAHPKSLAPWLFYDEAGSHLFDSICDVPEYYLTRTERALFEQLGRTLPGELQAPVTVAELGAGSAGKTGILLRAFAAAQGEVLYQPVDISATALEEAAASIEESIAGVRVEAQVANYITEGYRIARPAAGGTVLAMYIGSSIGNFSPAEQVGILENLRRHLEPDDTLLLGVDLAPGAEKSVAELVQAYDDAQGVTREFNRNVLVRLNRELGADFAVECFAHRAVWNGDESRMEMHLVALLPQTVTIEGERFRFAEGETIHTESSYKFTDEAIDALLSASGFALRSRHHDRRRRYAVVLATAV